MLAGIFVGGKGERLGGVPKGLLRTASGETLVDRWRAIFDELGVAHVLVGEHPAYASLGIETIADHDAEGASSQLGPLGGLVALLEHANRRGALALAVACDMPFVPASLVRRLLTAPDAPIVAPRRADRWETFFARHDASAVLPVARAHVAARTRALQALFDAAGAQALPLEPGEERALDDWDRQDDVATR
ncbi:Molybdopterin-guanine dinucleotide biosynthesis protein MobA [Labilithrix luteola]|uniref:Molybdopterin-guanine dinucleotide biosynthesis protein MobA n=1 Tax=Labilithrix luteola TaxID=1391654 RepID=A0A0K1PVR7_9BACT|nr:Molybdopterin-guanine dinucleotide biosynthesis protein MobA [Labilithrix luteola]